MREQSPPSPLTDPGDATVRMTRGQVAPPARCTVCGHGPLPAGGQCPQCGAEHASRDEAPPEDAPTEAPLLVDGRYRVESELGRGAMGVVHLARDTFLHRPVALKMIAPTWAALSPDAAASFQREAQSLASIRDQYVVQVYAFGLHGGAHFFAMEYVSGRTLRQILAEHRQHGDTIPVHRTLTILGHVAQGIDAVHAAGIVHRDVKPSNIVIEEHTGRPVLLDFGIAVHSADPAAALACGSPQYMAPEQGSAAATPATITERTDVYALGITAYEMLTGQLPFQATDRAQLLRQHARKKPPLLASLRRDLAPFDPVVARAIAKDPAERYPSGAAFAQALAAAGERWLSSTLPTLPPPPPLEASAAGEWVARSLPLPSLAPPPPSSAVELTRAGEPSRPFHVLVVDDSPVFRKFTVQATQLAFYRYEKSLRVGVLGAGSGAEALARAAELRPDLVLLDLDMPGLDGVGTLSRLRALPGGDRARVVVVSGRVSAKDRWRFAVLGVSDFVAKPIDFRALVDRIEAIARRYAEREPASLSP
jgi:serine/threonine-protein kinase